MRIKAKTGDIIRMKYSNSKNDPNPTIVYLATIKSKNGNTLVTGFNLNYIDSFKHQMTLIEFVKNFPDGLQAYDATKIQYPNFTESYRVYSEKNITSAFFIKLKKNRK